MLTADERVAQQDSTSNSEKLEIIYSRQVPSHITDIALHKTLQRKGYFKSRDDKNREWFDFPNCNTAKDASKQVREVLNGLINGVEALEDWTSFAYQQDIIDWAVQRSASQMICLLTLLCEQENVVLVTKLHEHCMQRRY